MVEKADQVRRVRMFVSQTLGEEWNVQSVEEVHIPFLPFPSWVVTSTSLGETPRTVRDLVVEKGWQFYFFDITDIVNLNDRLRVNEQASKKGTSDEQT